MWCLRASACIEKILLSIISYFRYKKMELSILFNLITGLLSSATCASNWSLLTLQSIDTQGLELTWRVHPNTTKYSQI